MTDFRQQLQDALGDAYQIERELTGGGMSRVFVATERALGRQVVIKVLPPDLAAGVSVERFKREIQLAAQLHHPHIVPLLSAGEHGDILYYSMPFIAGESLRARVEKEGKLPVKDVVRVLHDVVDALAYAHERGVIHRDIKPANILTLGAHALVTDFGVAKALSAAMPISGVTTAGIAIGTPAYMAPEQLAGDPAADHRMDIYAVGLLGYELLVGKSPFSEKSPQATLTAQLTRVPEPVDAVRPDVPLPLSHLIARCLAKHPEDRYATAQELLADLDAMSGPGGLTTATPVAPARARTTWKVAAGVLIALAAAAGVYALATGRGSSATSIARTGDSTRGAQGGPVDSSQLLVGGDSAEKPIVLTREDSMRIAAAVRSRFDSGRGRSTRQTALGADSIARAAESLTVNFQRAFEDSLAKVMLALRAIQAAEGRVPDPSAIEHLNERARTRAAPLAPGERRVVVLGVRTDYPRREIARIAQSVNDSVRHAVLATGRYTLVDTAMTREAVVASNTNPVAIGYYVGAGAVMMLKLTTRGDTSIFEVRLLDMWRVNATRVFTSPPAPTRQIAQAARTVLTPALAALDSLSWNTGRRGGRGGAPPPGGPGGPGSQADAGGRNFQSGRRGGPQGNRGPPPPTSGQTPPPIVPPPAGGAVTPPTKPPPSR
jgi:serine/threonine-protein kinase